MKTVLTLALFSLLGSQVFATSPIGGTAVRTKFTCVARLSQQIGNKSKTQEKHFTKIVNTNFEEEVTPAALFKLPAGLSGGYISLSAVNYSGRKLADLHIGTPLLKLNGVVIDSDSGDDSEGIDGARLKADTSFVARSASADVLVSMSVTCDLKEL